MADILHRKFYARIADPAAKNTFPASFEDPQVPVNPPGSGNTGIVGPGTLNRLAKFTSANTIGDSQLFDNGTDVGIGTDSPTEKLDVNGELRVRTINNLGTAANNVLVENALGVVSLRSLPEIFADAGTVAFPAPNGVVAIGSAIQTGNDIQYGTNWIWRISNINYSLSSATTINFPLASSGFIRRDLVVANSSGNISRVAGTEVENTEPSIAPNPTPGTVILQEILITDLAIDNVTNAALATFVRFDINNQNLSTVQRLNARTNIQALARDVADTKTEPLRFRWSNSTISNGTGLIDVVSRANNVESSVILNIRTDDGNELLRQRNRGDIYFDNVHGGGSSWVGVRMSKAGSIAFEFGRTTNQDVNQLAGAFKFFQPVTASFRSTLPVGFTRRDELPFNYTEVVGTDGILNDLAISDDTKLLDFTNADEITGIVPATTTTGRLLRIFARGTTIIIRNESVSSSGANRFAIGTDLTINDGEIYSFIYSNGKWRRSL